MTMRLALPAEKYKDSQQWTAFFERAEEEVKSVPGVVAAAMGSGAPMEMFGQARRYHVAGKSAAGDKAIGAEYFSVSPDYFRATGIPLRQGRYFNSADAEDAPRVAIVNETFVKREFPDKNPLGERIFLLGDVNASVRDLSGSEVLEIVGVVADTKEYRLYVEAPAIIYAPLRQSPQGAMALVIKGAGDPTLLLPEIRQRLLKLDPDQPIYNVKTLEQIIGEHHTLFRFNTFLLTVFAAIGLALSLIGLYSVIAYSVSQRINEFGIRIALGAQPQDIFKLVIGKCALLSATGLSLGLAASFPAMTLLVRTLKESMNLDLVGDGPILFIVVCGSMTVVALLASWLPARRATKVDPMVALRRQ
jgi:putative ABC transport system permease protein